MEFLHICFKGDVCISHAALTHFAHRHTHVIPGSSISMYHMSYLPVFQLYVLLCVNPNVPMLLCYPYVLVCQLACHLCGVLVKDPFSFVKKIYTK